MSRPICSSSSEQQCWLMTGSGSVPVTTTSQCDMWMTPSPNVLGILGLTSAVEQSRLLCYCVCLCAYMLSFGNANVGDLYINRWVSENWAFIRKSEGLGKLGIIRK